MDAPVEYDGVQYNGRIFISNSATNPINVIFGHELMHEIEKNNPELYAVLKNLFRDELSDSVDAIRNFYKTIGIDMSTLSDEEVLSEALNTFVGENLSDNGFWEKLNTENPSFARKLLDAIKELIRRIGEYFKGKTQNISGFVNNADSVIKMAERVIGEYAEGKVTQDQTQTPEFKKWFGSCLLYTSPSPRDGLLSRMPSSA